jgi:hypothetical protein
MTQQPKTDGLENLDEIKRLCLNFCGEANNRAADQAIVETVDFLAQRGMLNCGWMPIESAPRDGTRIIITNEKDIEIVHWGKRTSHFKGGWVGFIENPTHFMPLPAAPKMEVKRMSMETKDALFQEMLSALLAAQCALYAPRDSVVFNMAETAIEKAIEKAEKVK